MNEWMMIETGFEGLERTKERKWRSMLLSVCYGRKEVLDKPWNVYYLILVLRIFSLSFSPSLHLLSFLFLFSSISGRTRSDAASVCSVEVILLSFFYFFLFQRPLRETTSVTKVSRFSSSFSSSVDFFLTRNLFLMCKEQTFSATAFFFLFFWEKKFFWWFIRHLFFFSVTFCISKEKRQAWRLIQTANTSKPLSIQMIQNNLVVPPGYLFHVLSSHLRRPLFSDGDLPPPICITPIRSLFLKV